MSDISESAGGNPGMSRAISLGKGGVLFPGDEPLLIGASSGMSAALEWGECGHVVLLQPDPEESVLEELESFMQQSAWIAHVPIPLGERLKGHEKLKTRISVMDLGLSFMVGGVEVDVLPSGPDATCFSLMLEIGDILLLCRAALPGPATAQDWQQRFHLSKFLLCLPPSDVLGKWLREAPLDEDCRQRIADCPGAAHIYIDTSTEPWRAVALRERDEITID
jgi:hypothetical protein